LKKRKGSPHKPSSQKNAKYPVTKLQTTLTPDDFKFIVAALNDVAMEIVQKQETKQEEMYSWIEIELQGVQQELQSKRAVSTIPMSVGTPEVGDEPAQLDQIADSVEARIQKSQDEAEQATQDLTQV
jgi:hypothetical protein